jgi:hypothetical protein
LVTAGDGKAFCMATESQSPGEQDRIGLDRNDEDHQFVDPAQLEFDPDQGLYSGTAVDGTSEIPGPHVETGELGDLDVDGAAQDERQSRDQRR